MFYSSACENYETYQRALRIVEQNTAALKDSVSELPTNWVCSECGQEIPTSKRFCTACGTSKSY
jgi:hypothetical protein